MQKLPRLAFSGLLATTVLAGSAVAQVSISADTCDLDLDPGESGRANVTVTIPGEGGVPGADVYLLADNTGSMGTVIASVQAGASSLVSTLLGRPGVDIQIGVGQYLDFPFDVFAYNHQQNISADQTDVVNAINGWFASGGNDGSEGQFFALHQIATDAPGIGWRAGTKRIVVWFGDAPAHDPVCADINGIGIDIDEALVISSFASAGDGGTTVIAISTPTGFPLALNDDPTLSAANYGGICTIGGLSGQATRIADASGGIDTDILDPTAISTAILDAIEEVLSEVDVSLMVCGDILPFLDSITPPVFEDVQIPADPGESVSVTFNVDFIGQACQEGSSSFSGEIKGLIDGVAAASKPFDITQSTCAVSICLLLFGDTPAAFPLPAGGDSDIIYTVPNMGIYPVLLDSIPDFQIPDDPSLIGFTGYFQVVMNNPFDYPSDPVKTSNGLAVTVGDPSATAYGGVSGMGLFLDGDPQPGTSFSVSFSIF